MTDRIVITQDDVARVDVPRQPSPAHKQPKGPWIAGAICALIVVGVLIVGVARRPSTPSAPVAVSIQDYEQTITTQLDSDFNDSANNAYKNAKVFIETVQYPVTYKGARVKDVSLMTTDGSDVVLADESNLDRMTYTITYYWKGPVTTEGYTDVKYVYDFKVKQIVEKEYLDSNGKWNLDDPKSQKAIQDFAFWMGYLLGGM